MWVCRSANGEIFVSTVTRDDVEYTTVIDNRWVVPYNKWLSQKYNCHINVEVCASIEAVKYIYKYVYKGPDRAQVEISKVCMIMCLAYFFHKM